MKDIELAKKIAEDVDKIGGQTYFVGGYVRDLQRGIVSNDIDIEVFGIKPEELEKILSKYGSLREVGKSFGIYGIDHYGLDIALPRKEELIGNKHYDFKIDVDPYLTIEKAARRRDFTINALMQNVISGETIDPFNGLEDLNNKVIRHIDDKTFVEDPLRVLRAAQFAARFNFKVDAKTIKLCKTMNLSHLAKERVYEELKKGLLLSEKPSIFIETLKEMEQLNYWFEEIKNLIGIKQSPKHHQEGDAYIHTTMVLDAASKYKEMTSHPDWFMVTALCHDVGKAITTKIIDGKIKSNDHDIFGKTLAYSFISRLTNDKNMISYVLNMVVMHMSPLKILKKNLTVEQSNEIFDKSIEPIDLIYLSFADNDGKISEVDEKNLPELKRIIKQRYLTFTEFMSRDYVKGEDLIAIGYKPNEKFKELLEYAHRNRLNGISKENTINEIKQLYPIE